MQNSDRPLAILHLSLSIGETNAMYNEHCLPMMHQRDIAVCTFFCSDAALPPSLTLFEGNNTVIGFFRALAAAWATKEYDIVHAHTPHVGLLFLIFALFHAWKPVSASVYTVHSSFQNYTRLRIRFMLVPIFACFHRVVCCSQASLDSVPPFYRWLAGDRLCTVQNGVDIERIDRIAMNIHSCRDDGQFAVVSLGRLIDIKKPLTVLTAFQQAADPESRLSFIGDGNMRNRILEMSRGLDIECQVKLLGLISRDEVYDHLTQTDLLVSASVVEGLPVSVLEAMACRRPVLLSDIDPHREIAKDADFIPLIKPDDVEGFSLEMRRFREMPASERAAIGEKCRDIVDARFSLTAMHKGYEDVYRQVLE